jgi:hypothetical protein
MKDPSIASIPLKLYFNMTLRFGKQFVVYFNITLWSSAHDDFLMTVLHIVNVIFVDLTVVASSKDFEFKSVMWAILVNALRQKVDHDVRLSDVDQHIVFENDGSRCLPMRHAVGVHFLENSEADTQIFDVVPHGFWLSVKPNLKVTTSVLFSRLLVSRRNHKVIDDENPTIGLIFVGRHEIFAFIIKNFGQRPEVREAIGSSFNISRLFGLMLLSERFELICPADTERINYDGLALGKGC